MKNPKSKAQMPNDKATKRYAKNMVKVASRSVKTRRNPLSDIELFLQMLVPFSTWHKGNSVNNSNKPHIACLCDRPRRKSFDSNKLYLQMPELHPSWNREKEVGRKT